MSDQQQGPDLGDVVEAMVEIRDKRAELKKEFEKHDKALKEKWEKGERWILQHMQEQDIKNVGIRGFTVFQSQTLQAGIGDWDAIKQFIMDTGEVDLLQHRITSKVVQQYMEDNNGQVPPGVSTRTKIAINIRKAKGD